MPLIDLGGYEYRINDLIGLLELMKEGSGDMPLKIKTPLGSWSHILVAIDKDGREIPIF
jgi:hypothetical protein